jgi:two-component system nitrogen regulation sensor histidine kinase NtrY
MPPETLSGGGPVTSRSWTRHLWLASGGLLVVLLAAAVFTLGSLNVPVRPERGNAVILFALSTFIFAALLVFGLVLTRSLLRLWAERRAGQLGSRFKTKMVFGAMGVSLLPVVFLFFFSYALVNRTLNLWFPRPLEIAAEQHQRLFDDLVRADEESLRQRAQQTVAWLSSPAATARDIKSFLVKFGQGADAVWTTDSHDKLTQRAGGAREPKASLHRIRTLPIGAELWSDGEVVYLAGSAPYQGGSLFAGRAIPGGVLERLDAIESETLTYGRQKQQLRAYKVQILLALLLITLLLLFAATWTALFLSKQVTVPIQALAEATQEIAHGNFEHRVTVQAQDELGTLVSSFNQMTSQLGESRKQIIEFTRNLQKAVEELERRRKLMEAILENIPTGVLSLDTSGSIIRANRAVGEIFGEAARSARTMAEALGEEAARDVLLLMRKSLRMGVASRELEISASGRLLHAAVTVSSLGPPRGNPGFVVVIDDVTELLRAQKAAAWQEVAQRIAHEIKNPLTPIQLSAQRLRRHLERPTGGGPGGPRTDFERLVAECAGMIEREVATLESLVDEFSQFARFPAARLAPSDLNAIVASALDVFQGRLEGVVLRTELAASLPPVKADAELLRRVLINLIDNAAEAMEDSTVRKLEVITRSDRDGDAVEIEIADSGHGISPEDKNKLFLPHFSTKERGTGLGLAIASRIVAEHNGTLRVEDNHPAGARLLIRFPTAEVPANSAAAASPND